MVPTIFVAGVSYGDQNEIFNTANLSVL